ncbi:MAG: hypothetical protein M1380_03920, partial [Chloroflexi bacterium]|nr:hypothetical protein [Chloroflexota bacterium]
MLMSSERARGRVGRAAEEGFDELQAWCDAHPKYTLLDLEEQARVIRQRLMGEMMSGLVAQRGLAGPRKGSFAPGAVTRWRTRDGTLGRYRGRRGRWGWIALTTTALDSV